MPIVYDAVNNVMTVTGYTEAVPCTFSDLWNADKAGSRQLLAPTAAAVDLSLTTQPKPTDKIALKLNLIITGFSVAGEVTLTGLDKDDNAQIETISITANGTYVTTKWFKSIDAAGVDCTGSYTIEITQSQWGVVWKPSATQFKLDQTALTIGDGTTETWFIDKAVSVLFYHCRKGSDVNVITLRKYGHIRFGQLDDATKKTTSEGVNINLEDDATEGRFISKGGTGSSADFFGCSFIYESTSYYFFALFVYPDASFPVRIYNSIFSRIYFGFTYNFDIYNSYVLRSLSGLGIRTQSGGTFNRIGIYNCSYGVSFDAATDKVVSNILIRVPPTSYAIRWTGGGANFYLVNPDIDVWNIAWHYAPFGIIYRQYEFDLTVTDKDNNPISNATVTLKDKDGNTVFSATTDVNGLIATQTVSRGYYNQANGNTLQEYSPHTLTITKNGYQTYVKKFILSAKTVWEIKLAKAVGVFLSFGQPVINLKGAEPENKDVMVL